MSVNRSSTSQPERDPVQIALLGDVQVHAGRSPISADLLGGRRGEVVFARLVMESGHVVTREALADAVWEDGPPHSWQPALRNVIAAIRRLLAAAGIDGAAALRSSGAGYRLDLPPGAAVDVVQWEQAATSVRAASRENDYATALRLATATLEAAHGTFLASSTGAWIDAERVRLQAIRDDVRRVACEAALELGDAEQAECLARELVADAPLREDGHRLLIRALRAAGNTGEALGAYDTCRRLLADELGARPSPTTESLLRELLGQGPSMPERVPASGSLLRVDQQTPFVGRAAVLEQLAEHQRVALRAGPRIVIITGEPGIGKTRLAARIAARARDARMAVLYGRADDRISVPYSALLEAIESCVDVLDGEEIAVRLGAHARVLSRMIPSLAGIAPPSQPTGMAELDRRHITQSIEHALRAAAGEAGALVVLDDMHWASRTTTMVLEQIAASRLPAALLVLVLCRDEEQNESVAALGAHRAVHHLSVRSLAVDEVAELAKAIDGVDDPELVADVWRQSGGNPLFATELLRSWSPAARPG